jgi:hypothetical protein
MTHLQCRMAHRGHTGPSHYQPYERHSCWDPGHPDQFPYIDFWYILATHPPDWLHFYAPWRHTASLVNRKVKAKKFEVHHTLDPEPPDPPPVHPATLASLISESDSEDPNGKEEASEPNPHPCHPTALSLYPLLPLMAWEKDTNHWGRSPNSEKLTSKEAGTLAAVLCPLHQALGAAITPGKQVIRSRTHAICVPALHYHRPPELAAAHPRYSEEPQAVIAHLTNIMHSYQPNWDNCHQLMSTLFTSNEQPEHG